MSTRGSSESRGSSGSGSGVQSGGDGAVRHGNPLLKPEIAGKGVSL